LNGKQEEVKEDYLQEIRKVKGMKTNGSGEKEPEGKTGVESEGG